MIQKSQNPFLFSVLFSIFSISCFARGEQPIEENQRKIEENRKKIEDLDTRMTGVENKALGVAYNPSAYPLKEAWGINLFMDALLLKASDNGLAFAVPNPTLSNSQPQGRAKIQQQDWAWATRIGFGYQLPHDGWDIVAIWLRYYNRHSDDALAPSSSSYYPVRLNPSVLESPTQSFESIQSRWTLRLNQLDIALGRSFFVSKWLTLRPNFGLRTLWADQHFRILYAGGLGVTTDYKQYQKNDFWGMGLLFGLDTKWRMGGGWSLYANLDAALTYGGFSITNNTSSETTPSNNSNTSSKPTALLPILDAFAGLRWDKTFKKDQFHFGFYFGFEEHVYFNLDQLMQYVSTVAWGEFAPNDTNLNIRGFTIGAQINF